MVDAAPDGQATLAAALLLPRDTLQVSGPDRKSWLDGLLTCGVASVVPGAAAYGLLLTKQGKIVTDVFLVEDGASLFVGVAPGHGEHVRELLDRYLVMEDAELCAPSRAVRWELTLGDGPAERAATAEGRLSLGTLVARVAVVAAEAPGSHLQSPAVLAALLARHGLGVFGVDFTERDNPHEASLDRVAISWSKGCYLGQEVVCMQDMRGKVKRRLVALELAGPSPGVAVGSPVVDSSTAAEAGQVSSVHLGPGGAVLLASIATAPLESGHGLTVSGAQARPLSGPVSPERRPG